MVVKKESKHHHIWKNVFIPKCKLGKIQNIQVFETLCRHRPQTSRNNWKHHREKDMEIQGPVPPETDSSPFRIFQWLLQPSTSISCVLGSSICWVLHDVKIPVSSLLIVPAKKGTWLHLQFLLEKCTTQIFKNVWIELNWWLSIWRLATMWHWSPFVSLGFMAGLENCALPSWGFRSSRHPSGLENLFRHYLQLHIWTLKRGTNVPSQLMHLFLYKLFCPGEVK